MTVNEFIYYATLQFIASFIGLIAFAFIFHAPKKQSIFIAITGAFGWLTFIICTYFKIDIAWSSFVSAVVITSISRILSYRRHEPIITFLICGIFPIVPGAGIYYTGYYFFMQNTDLGLEKGFETLKIAIAIALGIAIVSSLPGILFSFKKKHGKESVSEKGSNN